MNALRLFPHTEFHHVGLVVHDIHRCNIPDLPSFVDPVQQVRVAFVDLMGCPIELVQPLNEHSPVSNSLKKNQKLLHLCFEVDHLDEAVERAEQSAFKRISPLTPAVAFGGRRITWLYHPVWGLVELLEKQGRE